MSLSTEADVTVKEDPISQARRSDRRRAPVDGGVPPALAERGRGAPDLHAEPSAGALDDPGEQQAARLARLIARLVAKQVSGQIGYWAAFSDEREVSHFVFTTDPAHADLSPENAASRTGAVAAIDRAIERYRAVLPSDAVAAATAAPATMGNVLPPPEALVGAPEHELNATPPEVPAGMPVCPFLGFRDDPSTRFDFPDAANQCHAASTRAANSAASARRFVPRSAGIGRPQLIAAEHQESCCLTAAHQLCARYPAGRGRRNEPIVEREGAPPS